MSRPGTHEQANWQARELLQHSLPGKSTNRKRRARLAGQIAEGVWKRWKVGIWQWQLKHLQWYLDVHLAASAPAPDITIGMLYARFYWQSDVLILQTGWSEGRMPRIFAVPGSPVFWELGESQRL